MPMEAAGVERKIHQLENDVSGMYPMITDIQITQRRHSLRFEELGKSMTRVFDRLSAAELRLDRVEIKVDRVETKVDALEARFDRLETKFDGLETRFDGLETRFDGLETIVRENQVTLVGVVDTLAAMTSSLQRL